MKYLLLTLIISISLSNSTYVFGQSYSERIVEAREEKNNELRSKKSSPLQKADRKAFEELYYFNVDEEWKVNGPYIHLGMKDTFNIGTSAGTTKVFAAHGMFVFSKGEHVDTLWAYKRIWPEGYESKYPPSLFIPFTDLTTGDLSYGGGRYLDIEIPTEEANEITVDFNLCYNPYCAYGGGFSCPIPPKRNFINLEVRAGEKNYHH